MSTKIKGSVIFLSGCLSWVAGALYGGGTNRLDLIFIVLGLGLIIAGVLKARGKTSNKKIVLVVLISLLISIVIEVASYIYLKALVKSIGG